MVLFVHWVFITSYLRDCWYCIVCKLSIHHVLLAWLLVLYCLYIEYISCLTCVTAVSVLFVHGVSDLIVLAWLLVLYCLYIEYSARLTCVTVGIVLFVHWVFSTSYLRDCWYGIVCILNIHHVLLAWLLVWYCLYIEYSARLTCARLTCVTVGMVLFVHWVFSTSYLRDCWYGIVCTLSIQHVLLAWLLVGDLLLHKHGVLE